MKRSLLVEADGGPLSVVIAGANVPDFKLLEATLDAIVIERPEPTEEAPQTSVPGQGLRQASPLGKWWSATTTSPHIRRIGEEKKDEEGEKRYPARRWVVERTLGWLLEVPRHPGTLREEGRQLSGADQGRLYPAVVPSSASFIPFEIVS